MDRIIQAAMTVGAILFVVGVVAIWGVVEYKEDERQRRERPKKRRG
jgi:heme/copper-type cytochrome/quinol oxidase subunit 2